MLEASKGSLLQGSVLEEAYRWLRACNPDYTRGLSMEFANYLRIPAVLTCCFKPSEKETDQTYLKSVAASKHKPTPEHIVLVRQSLKKEISTKRRWTLIFLAIATVILAAAITAVVFAIVASQQRAEAEAQKAEAQRQEAEAKRQEAEAIRQGEEAKRQEAEAKKQEAEAKKQEAEAKKQEAEAKKQEAEAILQRNEANAQREVAVLQRGRAEDAVSVSAAVSASNTDPELGLLFGLEAMGSSSAQKLEDFAATAELTLREINEKSSAKFIWTGKATGSGGRRALKASTPAEDVITIKEFASSVFFDFQTFSAVSPSGEFILLAAAGIVAPTSVRSPILNPFVSDPAETFQLKLLCQVFDKEMRLQYSVEDTLVGSANRTSFWPYYLSSLRLFVDNYGYVILHVRRMGFEKPVCQDAEVVTGIGCLPRTTGMLVFYSKQQQRKRGCLQKQDNDAGTFLLDVHDVFVGNNFIAVLTGDAVAYRYSLSRGTVPITASVDREFSREEFGGSILWAFPKGVFAGHRDLPRADYTWEGVWKGWESHRLEEPWRSVFACTRPMECIEMNPDTCLAPRKFRTSLRIFQGRLSFEDRSSAPIPGYIPNSPDLCHFVAVGWKSAALMDDIFAGADPLAAYPKNPDPPDSFISYSSTPNHPSSIYDAAYPYPGGFGFAPKTCRNDGSDYVVIAGEGSFFFLPVNVLSSKSNIEIQASLARFISNIDALKVVITGRQPSQSFNGQTKAHLYASTFASFGISDLSVWKDCSTVVGVIRQDGNLIDYDAGSFDHQSFRVFTTYVPLPIRPGIHDQPQVTRSRKQYCNLFNETSCNNLDTVTITEQMTMRFPNDASVRNYASITPWNSERRYIESGYFDYETFTYRTYVASYMQFEPHQFTKASNPSFRDASFGLRAPDPDIILLGLAEINEDPKSFDVKYGYTTNGVGAVMLRKGVHASEQDKVRQSCVKHQIVFMPLEAAAESAQNYWVVAELGCGLPYTGSPFDLRRRAMAVRLLGQGPFLVSGLESGKAVVHDIRPANSLFRVEREEIKPLSGSILSVMSLTENGQSLLISGDEEGNFAQTPLGNRLDVKSVHAQSPALYDGAIAVTVASNELLANVPLLSVFDKSDVSFRDILGPNSGVFTKCHFVAVSQPKGAYWDADGPSTIRRLQPMQVVKGMQLLTMQHTLDSTRSAPVRDPIEQCPDCNDQAHRYRFFGEHGPSGNLMALHAAGGTLYATSGSGCVHPSTLSPSASWTWKTDASVLPWTAATKKQVTYDGLDFFVHIPGSFEPFASSVSEFNATSFATFPKGADQVHPTVSGSLGGHHHNFFPNPSEPFEPLAFSGEWAALAGVLYPLIQGIPDANRARGIFEMDPSLRQLFIPQPSAALLRWKADTMKYKLEQNNLADQRVPILPNGGVLCEESLCARKFNIDYNIHVDLSDVQHAAAFSNDGTTAAFCFSSFSVLFDEKLSFEQFFFTPEDRTIATAPTCSNWNLPCPASWERGGSSLTGVSEGAETVIIAFASYQSAQWAMPWKPVIPAWAGAPLRTCRRMIYWPSENAFVVDMRQVVLVVKPSGEYVQILQQTGDALLDFSLVANFDPDLSLRPYTFSYSNGKNRLIRNTRDGPSFVDCSIYVSKTNHDVLWIVDAVSARMFNSTSQLEKLHFNGTGTIPANSFGSTNGSDNSFQFKFGKYTPRVSKNGRFIVAWTSVRQLIVADLEDGERAFHKARAIPIDSAYVSKAGVVPAFASISNDGRYLALRHNDRNGALALRIMDIGRDALLRSACNLVSRTFNDEELSSTYGTAERTNRSQASTCSKFVGAAAGRISLQQNQAPAAPAAPVLRASTHTNEPFAFGAYNPFAGPIRKWDPRSSKRQELTVYVLNTFSGDAVPTTADLECLPLQGSTGALRGQEKMKISSKPYLFKESSLIQPPLVSECYFATRTAYTNVLPQLVLAEFYFSSLPPDTPYSCTATVTSSAGTSPASKAEFRTLADATFPAYMPLPINSNGSAIDPRSGPDLILPAAPDVKPIDIST